MDEVSMNPPNRVEVEGILQHGKAKYGWRWLPDPLGFWWGACEGVDYILQVNPPPEPLEARQWNPLDGGKYEPVEPWKHLREWIADVD